MSDTDPTPPKTPKISEMIVGYVNLQVALFVAIVYGMKNLEPWPYGVGRCDIVPYLFAAGFLATTLLVLSTYAEGRAENLARRERVGPTRTFFGRAILIPGILFALYITVIHGPTDYCETFFSGGGGGIKTVNEFKMFIFSFVAACSSPALLFILLF